MSNPNLEKLSTMEDLDLFVDSAPVVVVNFAAKWCGACQGSRPGLVKFAASSRVPFGYVPDADGEEFSEMSIEAFPTYVFFKNNHEVDRVEGANFPSIQGLINKHSR